MKKCPFCAEDIQDAAIVCKHCGRDLLPGVHSSQMKNPGTAAVLSFFFAGLGQIYNGQIGKGLVLLFLYVGSILAMFVLVGFLTTPIIWIVGMVDAYKEAIAINELAVGIRKDSPEIQEPIAPAPALDTRLKIFILIVVLFGGALMILYPVLFKAR